MSKSGMIRKAFRITGLLLVMLITTVTLPVSAQVHGPQQTTNLSAPSYSTTPIDSVLRHYVDEGLVAGAVGLVLRDGEVMYEQAVGWADREVRRRMTTDAIFRIASQSKAITSTAIMMLTEDGRVNLDDPISRWIPSFEETTVAVKTDTGLVIKPAHWPVTIRDLLTHTSGISYGGESHIASLYQEKELGYGETYGWYTADKDEPICETMSRLGTLPFIQQPGSAWVYGYSTDILGCVVERASDKPLDEFIHERITGPLGMNDTYFYLPKDKKSRLATVYTAGDNEWVVRAPDGPRGQGHYVEGPRRSFSGGAGMLSTARDYARFLEMLRNGGTLDGKQYLKPKTVKAMTTNQVGTLFSDNGRGFSFGFQTTDSPGANGPASVGTFEWSGAYGSTYLVDPEEGLVITLMIQVVPFPGNGIRHAFKETVYETIAAKSAVTNSGN